MEGKVLVVCSVVGFFGLLSAALGFAAEATRVKVSQVEFTSPSVCSYPRSPAMALGLTAAVALMIAEVTINLTSGCICCERGPRPSNYNWLLALVCFVVSWFTFVIAFLLLLTGAALNDQHGQENLYFGNYCYVVKPGVFAGGAILSIASITIGILYFLTLYTAKRGSDHPGSQSNPPLQGNIAMGQPQIPTQVSQEPVFVHEDTYMRRQLA